MTDGPYDYGAQLDDQAHAQASSALAGVNGVSPQSGADAIQNAPVVGVPPSVAMRTPEEINTQSQQQRDQDVLRQSPPVRNFVATADPAHVAAAQDSLPHLASNADMIRQMYPNGIATPFYDIAASFGDQWGAIQDLAQKVPLIGNMIASSPQLAGALELGVGAQSVISGQFTTAGRVAAALGTPAGVFDIYRGTGANGKPIYTRPSVEESTAYSAGILGILSGVAGGESKVGSAAAEAEPFVAGGPPHITPTGPVHGPTGFVQDAEGGTANFPNVRAAGQFVADHGEADNSTYSYIQNPNGSVSLQARPIVPSVEGVPPVGVHPGVDGARAVVAQMDADHIASVQDNLAANPLTERSPQTMEAFLAQQTHGTVSVDAERIAELNAEGHDPFPELHGEVQRAVLDGTDVEVPVSRYLTATAGQPFAEALNKATVFRDGGVSVDDAKNAPSAGPESETGVVGAGGVSAQRAGEEPFTPMEEEKVKALVAAHTKAAQDALKASYLSPLFTDAEALGMTPAQFAAYSTKIADIHSNVVNRMQERAYNQVRRERSPEWKAEVASNVEKLSPQIEALPIIRAARQLSTPGFKLDRDLTTSFFPHSAARLDKSVLNNGGNHPDDAADLLGYPSGGQLVSDLADMHEAMRASGARNISEYVALQARGGAEAAAMDRLGHDMSPESIQRAAMELVNGPARTELMSAELQALGAGPHDVATLENYARQRFESLPVRRALNSRALEASVYKHGVRAEKALLKGDIPSAFLSKQRQFIQHLMAQQSYPLQKTFAKNDRVWSKWARKQLIKSVTPEYSAQILRVLRTVGYGVRRSAAELEADLRGVDGLPVSLEKFLATKSAGGPDNFYVPLSGESTRVMTVGEYEGLADMLNSMKFQGGNEQKVILAKRKVELKEQTDRAVAQLSARGREPITREELDHPTVLQIADRARRSLDAWATRPEQLQHDLDAGDPLGVFNQIVTLPIQERKAWRDEALKWVSTHLKEVRKELGKTYPKWLKVKIDEPGFLDPNGDRFFTRKSDVVGAALNWDNPDNRAKLIAGLNYGRGENMPQVTEDHVQTLLDTHMTLEAWKYAHGMWDMFVRFKNDMFGMYKRVNGISPKDVGTHYYPVSRDPRYLPAALSDDMKFAGDDNYFRATPANPHAKARTNAEYPLSLNLDLAQRRIFQVIHDIAFREVLMNADKFLGARDVTNAISRHYGPEYAEGLRSWLQDIAGDQSFNARDSQAVKDFLDYTSEGAIIDMIGYSAHTVLLHGPTALVQSMQTVGPVKFASALAEMFAKPAIWKQIWDESPEIRNRITASSEGARNAFLHLYGEQGWISQLQLYSLYGVSLSDQFSAMPTYWAAKKAFLSDPRTAPFAQSLAEQQVRQAHGSGGVVDAPAALRGGQSTAGKLWRQANQFLTFYNHMYNRQREIGQNLGFAGNKRDFPAAMAGLFSFILAVGTIHHVVNQLFGRKSSWLEDVALTPFMGVPIVDYIPAIIDAKEQHLPTSAIQNLAVNLGLSAHDLERFVQGERVSPRWIQHAGTALGVPLHAPGNQIGKTLAGLHDLATRGQITPTRVVRELIAGPDRP